MELVLSLELFLLDTSLYKILIEDAINFTKT